VEKAQVQGNESGSAKGRGVAVCAHNLQAQGYEWDGGRGLVVCITCKRHAINVSRSHPRYCIGW
jgi:hypothetical protein